MYTETELLSLTRAYMDCCGVAESTLSVVACGNDRTLPRLLAGCGCSARIAERASKWFDAHWPGDATWPPEVYPSRYRQMMPQRKQPAQVSQANSG
jgi:hypothetical protein